MTLNRSYTFCESARDDRLIIRCIRPLKTGPKYVHTGDIDTASLCGRIQPIAVGGDGGWDVPANVEETMNDRQRPDGMICARCSRELRQRELGGGV